jgi:phosphonate transport system substrate-binding protein
MRRVLVLGFAVALVLTACGGAPSSVGTTPAGVPKTLRVGLIPNISPEKQRATYRPFAEYLASTLGVKVDLFVASDYAGVVAALVGKRIDVAYLGGLTFAQAERQVPLRPLVTEVDRETGTPKYLSAIVVRNDSPAKDLRRDIVAAGKRFAFGDISSTSGSLYPRMMLVQAGARCATTQLDHCPPLASVRFTGGHDATAEAVLSGQVDAGGLELRILHRLERDGTIPPNRLRVIAQREVQGYPWVIRRDLGDPAAGAVRRAFLSIKDPKLLDLLRARSYVAVGDADYQEIRQRAGQLGLLGPTQ